MKKSSQGKTDEFFAMIPVATVFLFCLLCLLISCSAGEPVTLVPEEYDDWQRTTQEDLRFPIPGHEDNLRRIFINQEGLDYRTEMEGDRRHFFFPEETVIVKEIYEGFSPTPGEEPTQLTVMIKKPNHPDSLGGWLWLIKDPGSGKENIITNEFCHTCHSNANEAHPYADGNPTGEFRDYVFYPPSKE